MKAIPTEYNGYTFRSRLEARWAVFFDALSIEYEYENEGYDLDGVRYLPDFWLPRLDLWVEVKGERLKSGSDDEEKIKRLVKDSRKPVAVFWGQINSSVNLPDLYMIAESLPDWDTMKVCEALVIDRSSSWTECPVCHMVGLARNASPSLLPCGCCKDADRSPGIIAAYADARKARFEYEDAKPKQKIKTSPSIVQQAREEFKEAIRQMQVETKKPSSLPNWDDVPFPDEPDKTDDVHQQPVSVSPPHFDDVLLPELPDWDDVPQPSPSLTVEKIRSHWDYVKRRVKSKKDGAKIAALLNGYIVVGVEGTQELPVVIIQANADFFYNALSSGLQNNVDWLPAIEWAFKVELGRECKISLKPLNRDIYMSSRISNGTQFNVNDRVIHSIFGEGIVLKSELEGKTEFVNVQFDGEHGMKRLSMDFAKLEKLSDMDDLEDHPFQLPKWLGLILSPYEIDP